MLKASRRIVQRLRAAQRPDSKSLAQQAIELLNLQLRQHLSPAEYYAYNLHRKGIGYADMARYIPGHFYWQTILPRLNQREWVPIVANKWIWHRHFDGVLPLPRLIGVVHPINGVDADGAPLRTGSDLIKALNFTGATAVVIKPVAGSMGQGVLIVDEVSSRDVRVGSRILDGSAIDKYAQGGTGLVVEEKLDTHEFFTSINPYTATTIRIVTLVGESQEVLIPFGVVRMGRAGSMVDNYAQGGLAIELDIQDGVMQRGMAKINGGWQAFDEHPDSGIPISREQIPLWAEVVDLCKRAARLLPGLRSIGWDVLLTPNGPALLEANHDWDVVGEQMYRTGLTDSAVLQLLSENGITYSSNRLPPISLWR